jgi:cell division septal protein FtsQ
MDSKNGKAKGFGKYIIFLIFVIGFLYLVYSGVIKLFGNFNVFNVTEIQICGNQNINETKVFDLTNDFIGQNLFKIKKSDIIKKFNEVPRIKKVSIKKRLLGKIVINLQEREGLFLIIDKKGSFYSIDQEKIVIDKTEWFSGEDLPIINFSLDEDFKIGEKIDNKKIDYIFSIYEKMKNSYPEISEEISEFYYIDDILYYIDIISGCRVRIIAENINEQLKRYIVLRDNQGFESNSIIDIRFNSIIIKV